MVKWNYTESNLKLNLSLIEEEDFVYVHRSFAVYDEPISGFSHLTDAMEHMFEGITHTEYIEGCFDVAKEGPRSKPRFTIELTVGGSRKITEKEEKQRSRERKEAKNEDEHRYLRQLRIIKAKAPHLFDTVNKE